MCVLPMPRQPTRRSLSRRFTVPLCAIYLDRRCARYPDLPAAQLFSDVSFGGPQGTSKAACLVRREAWQGDCGPNVTVSARFFGAVSTTSRFVSAGNIYITAGDGQHVFLYRRTPPPVHDSPQQASPSEGGTYPPMGHPRSPRNRWRSGGVASASARDQRLRTWVFVATADSSTDWQKMTRVAVRSALLHTNLRPVRIKGSHGPRILAYVAHYLVACVLHATCSRRCSGDQVIR